MRFNYSIAKKEWCFELSAIFWGQKKISLFAQGNEPPRPPFSAFVFDWLRGGLSEMDMFLKTAFFKCPLHDSTFMRDADIKTQNPPRSQLFFDVFALTYRKGEAFGSWNALREHKFWNQVTTHQSFPRTLGLGDELLLKYWIKFVSFSFRDVQVQINRWSLKVRLWKLVLDFSDFLLCDTQGTKNWRWVLKGAFVCFLIGL